MARKNPHAIGATFERDVAKLLSTWHGQDQAFQRRPTAYENNGIMTGQRDIMHRNDVKWPFTIQCKKDETFELHHLTTGTGNVWKHWRETLTQCQLYDGLPLLIITRNLLPIYAATDQKGSKWLWDNSDEGIQGVVCLSVYNRELLGSTRMFVYDLEQLTQRSRRVVNG